MYERRDATVLARQLARCAASSESSRVFQVRPAGSTWMCGANSAGGIEPEALSKALRRKVLRKSGLDASQADAGGCIMAAEGRSLPSGFLIA